MKSYDQQRAAHAWSVASQNRSKDFLRVAQNAPAMIMSSGLMPTLAFLQSKGSHHEKLLKGLLDWLSKSGFGSSGSFQDVMSKLHGSDAGQYMRATEEALEWLKWVRHFAKALSSK